MNSKSEIFFRIAFGILWIVYFVVRIYFQRKVKGSNREYVLVNEKKEKLFFSMFAVAYLVLPIYFLTSWVDFAHLPMPIWARWTGCFVTCAGIGLFGWAHQALGKNWTAVLALSEKHVLVTSGPYHYVRHPMYTAFFIIGIGFFLLSTNWLVGIIYLGTLSLMYMVRISAEEKMMLDRFGDDYRQYMKKTGRILPRLWK
jgi:protein-S-isoprenylcysteine O-methyltransferase Ste14